MRRTKHDPWTLRDAVRRLQAEAREHDDLSTAAWSNASYSAAGAYSRAAGRMRALGRKLLAMARNNERRGG